MCCGSDASKTKAKTKQVKRNQAETARLKAIAETYRPAAYSWNYRPTKAMEREKDKAIGRELRKGIAEAKARGEW
ncbi:hypothetical protein FVEN_g7689 [Fusarium venenatum]|uniref:Uncharacterized protein n=1 Tax=Fusarium venenatum TaxID=56646 RepID=A0A2L2TJ41_9HYPO|nr:uncharacterized protein FVRRES_08120 [Fusarium venenatum]KAG8354381.1 hypothetical protein FVEN_g7689 [Fusarium venenatum]CEI68043.1 unnamed protein product [Fusarium venenatum]